MALNTTEPATRKNVRPRKKPIKYVRERMNYYGPRQRKEDNHWDYTVEHDTIIRPVGYCAGWTERTEVDYKSFIDHESVKVALAEQEARRAHVAKYHTTGHEHAEEACLCYRVFLLDNALRLNMEMYDTLKPCLICGTVTNMCAEIDTHNFFILCDLHRSKEEVEHLYLRPGIFKTASSY